MTAGPKINPTEFNVVSKPGIGFEYFGDSIDMGPGVVGAIPVHTATHTTISKKWFINIFAGPATQFPIPGSPFYQRAVYPYGAQSDLHAFMNLGLTGSGKIPLGQPETVGLFFSDLATLPGCGVMGDLVQEVGMDFQCPANLVLLAGSINHKLEPFGILMDNPNEPKDFRFHCQYLNTPFEGLGWGYDHPGEIKGVTSVLRLPSSSVGSNTDPAVKGGNPTIQPGFHLFVYIPKQTALPSQEHAFFQHYPSASAPRLCNPKSSPALGPPFCI